MLIQILNVTPLQATTKTGKPYTKAEVAYKNLTFNKVESKVLMPFGATEGACKTLLAATSGSKYEITVVKNDAGYNDWTSVTPSDASAPVQAAVAAPQTGGRSTGSTGTVKSTYETAEERAARQILIVRQSSVSSAIALLSAGSKGAIKVDAVVETAHSLKLITKSLATCSLPCSRVQDIMSLSFSL